MVELFLSVHAAHIPSMTMGVRDEIQICRPFTIGHRSRLIPYAYASKERA